MKNANLLILLILVGFCSCKNESQSVTSKKNEFSYPETIIPDDITKLWVEEGDREKDTVLIVCQGGPKNTLDFIKNGRSSWRYLENYKNYYKVHLHKASTFNTEMFNPIDEFTIEMARKEIDNSSEFLLRTISHFKEKGKIVYVVGHSYGAYIIQHYLATRKSLADKYVISSGRIDDPKDAIESHTNGFNGEYVDGVNFVSEENRDFSGYSKEELKWYKTKQLLKAAAGEISYSKTLRNVDLEGTIYVYTSKDKRVGGLSEKEISFLKTKGVQVYETRHEEHGNTIYGVVDGIKEGKLKF